MTNSNRFLMIAAVAFAHTAHAGSPVITQKALKPAVEKYLQDRGNFCLGKFDWPIVVSATDRQAGTNDAIQMPVLERLGLVASSVVAGDPAARQFDLTAEGKKYYIVKKTVVLGPGDKPVDHPGDFCAAKLELDRIVSWRQPEVVGARPRTEVKYTYKVARAADWTHNLEVRKVFPLISRIMDEEGKLQLTQPFEWSNDTWVAVTPGG